MKISRMFLDLLLGILVYALIGEILILCLFERKIYITIGFATGIAYAIYSLIGINESVNSSVMMTEEGALKNTRNRYIRRILVIILILALFWFVDFGSPVAFIIGAMGLKFSAFIQPVSDKVLDKVMVRRN